MDQVKALYFDVFGTTVDWRTTVVRALRERCAQNLNSRADRIPRVVRDNAAAMQDGDGWDRFAHEWRQTYYAFTRKIARAAIDGSPEQYKTIDEHQLESLNQLLVKWELEGLWDVDVVQDVSRIWHALDPWPDTVAGLSKLRQQGLQTCTLSNGNVELLVDLVNHANLDMSNIFSAEMFQSYKPDPKVYLGAVDKLNLSPQETGMVACHLGDLDAARKVGMRTIYVERHLEEAWEEVQIEEAKSWVDIWVDKGEDGFLAVARLLAQHT